MKRIFILCLCLICLTACGAATPQEASIADFEVPEAAEASEETFPIIRRSFWLSDILDGAQYDSARLAYSHGMVAGFILWQGDQMEWVKADIYGGGIVGRQPLGSFDYYMGATLIDSHAYGVFANWGYNANFDICIVDLESGLTAHLLPSDKLPFWAGCQDRLFVTAYLEGKGDTVYSFDGEAVQEVFSLKSAQKDGLYSGEVITAFGCTDDNVWLQISQPHNQPLESAPCILSAFSPDFLQREDWQTGEVYSFVGGGTRIFASVYGYPDPVLESG